MPSALPFYWDKRPELETPYVPPDEETRLFIEAIYTDLAEDADIRRRPESILDGGSIEDVWARSIEDYTLYVPGTSRDDIVKQYVSPISRDKTNTFVSTVFGAAQRPSVRAQNKDQEVDVLISRVLKTLLDHAYKTDGMPSSNGRQKRQDALLIGALEGTAFVQEEYTDGKCVRTLIPNEQVYVPNPWQSDIQAQGHVLRVVNDVTYTEARLAYGHFEAFEHVRPGGNDTVSWGEWSFWKDYRNALETGEGMVQIVHSWYPIPGKKQRYHNILINGVPMNPWDHRSPFKHGYCPISPFTPEKAHPQYFWGISIPWKVRHEKSFQDALKTVMRFKNTMSGFPSLLTSNADLTDERLFTPATLSLVDRADMENPVVKVPGPTEGVSSADIQLLQLSNKETDESTTSPVLAGQQPGGSPTAREISAVVSYAQRNQSIFADRFSTHEIALDWMRIANIIQFYTRKKVDGLAKISVPDAQLLSGRSGTMEVLFKKIPQLSEEEELDFSMQLREREQSRAEEKQPTETVIIDPAYIKDIDWYLITEDQSLTDIEIARELDFAARAAQNPFANQEEVWRDVVRAFGKDEDRHVKKPQEAPPGAPQGQQGPPQGGAPPPEAQETNLPNVKELARTAI